MEKLLAELLASAGKPLIAALEAHTAELKINNEHLSRVVAGQEAAMAKLDGTAGAATRKPRQTAAEKKAAEDAAAAAATPSTSTPAAAEAPVADPVTPPAAKVEPVAAHPLLAAPNGETAMVLNKKTGLEEDTPTANFRAADFGRDQVKGEFIGWLGESADIKVRQERANFVGDIGKHFGVSKPFDPSAGLPDDGTRKQTLFFLRRKREGLAVDFSADYDFDADPLADQTTEGAGDDEFDALG